MHLDREKLTVTTATASETRISFVERTTKYAATIRSVRVITNANDIFSVFGTVLKIHMIVFYFRLTVVK